MTQVASFVCRKASGTSQRPENIGHITYAGLRIGTLLLQGQK